MKETKEFIAEAIRNVGVGLIVSAFVLKISERISALDQWLLLFFGFAHILLGIIVLRSEGDGL